MFTLFGSEDGGRVGTMLMVNNTRIYNNKDVFIQSPILLDRLSYVVGSLASRERRHLQ